MNVRIILAALALSWPAARATDLGASEYDRQLLHHPPASLLAREDRGEVTIYERVYAADIERAMDEQFERVDKMMFVHTLQREPDGSIEEEDDCDD